MLSGIQAEEFVDVRPDNAVLLGRVACPEFVFGSSRCLCCSMYVGLVSW